MFLKVKKHIYSCEPPITMEIRLNTDHIVSYYRNIKNTCTLELSNGQRYEIEMSEEQLDDILLYKNCDPTPVKEIDDHINMDDNPLGFSTESENDIEEQKSDERLATSKQIAYVRSIAKKKGLDLKLPKTITFEFARQFLDKYAPKKKKQTSEFDWEQLDEDADGEFPGYRD